jgi:hypothetical protein
MRLVCLHADTVQALSRLNIKLDDLTPNGLWSSQYHLIGLTPDQVDALAVFGVETEDITPAQLAEAQGTVRAADAEPRASSGGPAGPTQAARGGQRPPLADRAEQPAPEADAAGREPSRAAAGGGESEVPLTQSRDGSRSAEKPAANVEAKPNGKAPSASAGPATQPQAVPQAPGQKGGKGGQQAAPNQGNRKGQPAPGQGSQRYGTTRLRISVAGKYTEATVANGKIVVAGRSFDTPDQAAAELTKSRGDWTFWEYYDSTDGKWRMLTRDWDSVLKSATPGGR